MINANPPEFRFHRPILWETDDELYRYIPGGTANIVRLCGRDFILTARHCLESHDKPKEYYPLEAAKIPYRLNSEAYCRVGKGASPFPKDPDEEDTALCDLRIHLLEGPSCDDRPLEAGEYLELHSFEPSAYFHQRYLSGFPKQEQWQEYERRELGGTGLTIGGTDGGPTNDSGCRKFLSRSLRTMKSNGLSGGLITTNVLGNVQLEGICVQGGENIDFIRFISVEVIQEAFRLAWPQFFPPGATPD